MAGRDGIDIPLVLDSSGVAAGSQKAIKSINDVADNLDDLEREAKRSDALEDSLEDAERQADDTADSLGDLARAADRAGDKAGDSITRGFKRSEDAAEGFKSEATQNFAEVASSFDGSMQGVADGVQGTLGGLATSIGGPLGLAAAGLGAVAGAALTSWIENTEEIEERVSDMYDDMLDSGNAYLSADFVNDSLSEIIQDEDKLNDARKDATALGLELNTVLRAQAGDQESLNTVIDRANELHEVTSAAYREQLDSVGRVSSAKVAEKGVTENLVKQYGDLAGNITDAANQSAIFRDASIKATESAEGTAEAIANIPETVNTTITITEPDTGAIFRNMQSKFDTGKLTVKAKVVDSYGRALN